MDPDPSKDNFYSSFSDQHCLIHTVHTRFELHEALIKVVGRTLEAFDDDNIIPAYRERLCVDSDRSAWVWRPRDQGSLRVQSSEGYARSRNVHCKGFPEVLGAYPQ